MNPMLLKEFRKKSLAHKKKKGEYSFNLRGGSGDWIGMEITKGPMGSSSYPSYPFFPSCPLSNDPSDHPLNDNVK